MCMVRDCAVCECDPDEIPVCWRAEDGKAAAAAAAVAAAARPQVGTALVDASAANVSMTESSNPYVAALSRVRVDVPVGERANGGGNGRAVPVPPPVAAALGPGGTGDGFLGWKLATGEAAQSVWTVEDPDSADLKYVNLLKNPEAYTGSVLPVQARRMWSDHGT
jgi:hypothetical protein